MDLFQDAIRALPAGKVVTLADLRSLLPPNVGISIGGDGLPNYDAKDEHGQNGWHRETLLRGSSSPEQMGVTYR